MIGSRAGKLVISGVLSIGCGSRGKIPKKFKDQFKKSAGKKIRGITVVIKRKKDVAVYKEMLALKMATV